MVVIVLSHETGPVDKTQALSQTRMHAHGLDIFSGCQVHPGDERLPMRCSLADHADPVRAPRTSSGTPVVSATALAGVPRNRSSTAGNAPAGSVKSQVRSNQRTGSIISS